jgi:hypothetical protein
MTRFIRALEDTDPLFFNAVVAGTPSLAAMPGIQHFDTLSDTAQTNMDSISAGNFCALLTSTPDMEPQVHLDPRRPYQCGGCGKFHDRRDRASDCENAKRGLKPYGCQGRCGKQAWFVPFYTLSPRPTTKLLTAIKHMPRSSSLIATGVLKMSVLLRVVNGRHCPRTLGVLLTLPVTKRYANKTSPDTGKHAWPSQPLRDCVFRALLRSISLAHLGSNYAAMY